MVDRKPLKTNDIRLVIAGLAVRWARARGNRPMVVLNDSFLHNHLRE